MRTTILFLFVTLSGCASGTIVVADLDPPASRYMATPYRCPVPPTTAKFNKAARDYAADLKSRCRKNQTKARGLQAYARALLK